MFTMSFERHSDWTVNVGAEQFKVEVSRLGAAAWTAWAHGRHDEALVLMRSAADIERIRERRGRAGVLRIRAPDAEHIGVANRAERLEVELRDEAAADEADAQPARPRGRLTSRHPAPGRGCS